jgi:hypothetical protein
MFLQRRNLPDYGRLAHPALTGDGRKEPVSTTRTKTLSAPRRSIDFLEKRKSHSKESGIISLRQDAYVRSIAYRHWPRHSPSRAVPLRHHV